MSRNRVKVMLSVALVLFMTFPSIVRAGSAGNSGEVEFYYEDSSLPATSDSKVPVPTPTTPSKTPSKILSLPQTGEKNSSYYLIGIIILLAGIWGWQRQAKKRGVDHD